MQKDEWKTDPAEALGQIRLLLENLQTNIEECNKQRNWICGLMLMLSLPPLH